MERAAADRRGELLWEPPAEMVERAAMTAYMRWLADERDRSFHDYGQLWQWSVS
jgi:acetoacetyl-CoA synthetase